MTPHNWIRCHWRNGRHVLHDVPETWHTQIESHLAANRARAEALGRIQTATLESVELAWVECEVPLGSPERDLTYRRARAVHALVRSRSDGGSWTCAEAEALLHERYTEPPERGLVSQHRVLATLEYPQDASCADGLFVGREAGLPTASAPASRAHDIEATGYAQRHLIDAWEDWVAEGAKQQCTPSRSGPRPVKSPDDLMAPVVAPLLDSRPPTIADVAVECGSPDEACVASVASPRPFRESGAEAGMAPAEKTADDLFDLTRVRSVRPDAPSSSLSGLLGPSRSTPTA